MWPILRSVTPTSMCDNFDKCDPFYRVWLTFPSLTHLAKCDPFCAASLVLPSAPILISVTHVYQVWLTFPSLTHLAKCDPFCPVWLLLASATILISVTHFIECDSPSQVWPIWPNVTHFAQCDSYFQVRRVILIKIVALGSSSHTAQNGWHLAKWVKLGKVSQTL